MTSPWEPFSMSAATRAMECQHWLRDGVRFDPDVSTVYARLGNAFHECAAALVMKREPNPTTAADEQSLPPYMRKRLARMFDVWASWWATFHRDLPWQAEVKVAMRRDDSGECCFLPPGKHREYLCDENWTPGTADVVCDDGETVHLYDWKTGHGLVSADQNGQVRMLGTAFARLYGRKRAIVGLGRVSEFGVRTVPHPMTESDFLSVVEDHAAVWRMRNSSEPAPGPWCKETYCRVAGCVGRERAA